MAKRSKVKQEPQPRVVYTSPDGAVEIEGIPGDYCAFVYGQPVAFETTEGACLVKAQIELERRAASI